MLSFDLSCVADPAAWFHQVKRLLIRCEMRTNPHPGGDPATTALDATAIRGSPLAM
ncbi:hypothetical protein [Streptomyces sp. NPDC001037]|uniref:hypothetical protein n=1 Tax=Streptomyces sp. NPDC001037 TaxID=3364542 RepID=UPI003675D71C